MAAGRTACIIVCAGVENTVSGVGEAVGEGVGKFEVGRALMPDTAGYAWINSAATPSAKPV